MILPKIIRSYNPKNHLLLIYDNARGYIVIFQSYDSVMFSVSNNGVILNEDLEDYTQTTRKYMYQAMDDVANDYQLASYTSRENMDVLNAIITGEKSKNILKHMARQTAYIYNTGDDAYLKYKDE